MFYLYLGNFFASILLHFYISFESTLRRFYHFSLIQLYLVYTFRFIVSQEKIHKNRIVIKFLMSRQRIDILWHLQIKRHTKLFFFDKHSRFTGHQGKEDVISVTPLGHFHPLHRHLTLVEQLLLAHYTVSYFIVFLWQT